jgi:tRNA threonylcarbamoyladenosine biosynthesis protein TsaE
MVKIVLKNLDEKKLSDIAKKLSRCVKGNEIFLLIGDLGAGKTTFVKHFVASIDKSLKDEVNSPTFTIMNIYETERFNIYHIDLYRVKEFDLTDFLGSGVIFIEWPKKDEFTDIDYPLIKISFKIGDDLDKRNLEIDILNGEYIINCLKEEE